MGALVRAHGGPVLSVLLEKDAQRVIFLECVLGILELHDAIRSARPDASSASAIVPSLVVAF